MEKICDRVAIIRDGKLAAVERIDELKRKKVYRIHAHLDGAFDHATFQMENVLMLESPVGEDDDERSTLGSFIADDTIASPDMDASRRILNEQMSEILEELSPKERKILEMRNGLTDEGICYTLEEVGREFGVTRERIRQIEAKALERIRFHERAKQLRSY